MKFSKVLFLMLALIYFSSTVFAQQNPETVYTPFVFGVKNQKKEQITVITYINSSLEEKRVILEKFFDNNGKRTFVRRTFVDGKIIEYLPNTDSQVGILQGMSSKLGNPYVDEQIGFIEIQPETGVEIQASREVRTKKGKLLSSNNLNLTRPGNDLLGQVLWTPVVDTLIFFLNPNSSVINIVVKINRLDVSLPRLERKTILTLDPWQVVRIRVSELFPDINSRLADGQIKIDSVDPVVMFLFKEESDEVTSLKVVTR